MKEDQLREDQRREALARKEEPHAEHTLPPSMPRVEEPSQRVEEPSQRVEEPSPRVEEPPLPKIDSKALLESDGLVMIETDRAKAPVLPVEEPAQQLGRPRRERPKPPPQEEELQQVETRK
jgi:ribonuclease E